MTITVGNQHEVFEPELQQSIPGARQEEERVVVATFLDVCARTLDGYRAALAHSQVDQFHRLGGALRSAASTLGIEPPAMEEGYERRVRIERCCAFHTLGKLYAELECLSRGLQVLSSES